jgi:hypothetical protein
MPNLADTTQPPRNFQQEERFDVAENLFVPR